MDDQISSYRQWRLIGTVPSRVHEEAWCRLDLLAVRRGVPRSETLGTWESRVVFEGDVERYASLCIERWALGQMRPR